VRTNTFRHAAGLPLPAQATEGAGYLGFIFNRVDALDEAEVACVPPMLCLVRIQPTIEP
jgi:hypothetical protein